jgi:hypothetical protein
VFNIYDVSYVTVIFCGASSNAESGVEVEPMRLYYLMGHKDK